MLYMFLLSMHTHFVEKYKFFKALITLVNFYKVNYHDKSKVIKVKVRF